MVFILLSDHFVSLDGSPDIMSEKLGPRNYLQQMPPRWELVYYGSSKVNCDYSESIVTR
jgi:hypothetical protein